MERLDRIKKAIEINECFGLVFSDSNSNCAICGQASACKRVSKETEQINIDELDAPEPQEKEEDKVIESQIKVVEKQVKELETKKRTRKAKVK